MQPLYYTGLKIIHDQKIQEALEQQHLHTGEETPGRKEVKRAFGKLLARFTGQPARKQEVPLPGCAC